MQRFSYDTLDRLWTASATGGSGGTYSHAYSYDPMGRLSNNGTNTLAYANSSHRHAVSSAGANSYSYDATGNQTTRVVGGVTQPLKYDAENRLIEVWQGTTLIASYNYYGQGNRIRATHGGAASTYLCNLAKWTGYFCTCDDRLLRRARQISHSGVTAVNPIELVQELGL